MDGWTIQKIINKVIERFHLPTTTITTAPKHPVPIQYGLFVLIYRMGGESTTTSHGIVSRKIRLYDISELQHGDQCEIINLAQNQPTVQHVSAVASAIAQRPMFQHPPILVTTGTQTTGSSLFATEDGVTGYGDTDLHLSTTDDDSINIYMELDDPNEDEEEEVEQEEEVVPIQRTRQKTNLLLNKTNQKKKPKKMKKRNHRATKKSDWNTNDE